VSSFQFINLASESSFVIGKGLESCTTTVESTDEFEVGGERVILLDTPGFDDTNIRDIDILEEIANYMNKMYVKRRFYLRCD
jgi:predicted GTPase